MGLIAGLLTLPLAPVRGVAWLAEKAAEQAELELHDENRIMRELADLEQAKEVGEINEARFAVAPKGGAKKTGGGRK